MINMMKKVVLVFLGIGLLSVSGGCSQEKQEVREDLSKADVTLTASTEREKSFSVYQLQNVGREEAKAAVTEKLQLQLPSFTEKIEELTFKHLEANEQLAVDSTLYSFSSKEREAAYSVSAIMKNEEGLYPIYSSSQIDYAYNSSEKIAFMDMYKLEVVNNELDGIYNGGDLQEYILALGEAAAITADDIAGELELLVAKSKEELKNQHVVLYDTFDKAEKERTLGKRLRIAYGEKGVPVKIQLYLKDYHYSR